MIFDGGIGMLDTWVELFMMDEGFNWLSGVPPLVHNFIKKY